jgi:hypothetical protein
MTCIIIKTVFLFTSCYFFYTIDFFYTESSFSINLKLMEFIMFDAVPYGVNGVNKCYSVCKGWYTDSFESEGCAGTMERAGKAILVAPAHLLTATLVGSIAMIYDLVMSAFFLVANICTAFQSDELRERLTSHVYSLLTTPGEMFKNAIAALAPPLAYRSQDAVNIDGANVIVGHVKSVAIQATRQAIRSGIIVRGREDFLEQMFVSILGAVRNNEFRRAIIDILDPLPQHEQPEFVDYEQRFTNQEPVVVVQNDAGIPVNPPPSAWFAPAPGFNYN